MIKRMLEKPEYVLSYIKHESDKITSTKFLRDNYILFLLFTIPTGFLGIYKHVTIPIILSLIIILGIWSMNIGLSNKKKDSNFILFHGVYSVLLSLTCILAAYKLLSYVNAVSIIEILIILLTYILFTITYNLHVIRAILKGWYLSGKVNRPLVSSIIPGCSVLGLAMGRLIGKTVNDNDTIIMILALLLVLLGVLMTVGTQNLLKYYFIRKIKEIDGVEL